MFEEKAMPKPKINFTPLIDIIFLLVMFFMLTTSFIRLEALDVSVAQPDKLKQLPKKVDKNSKESWLDAGKQKKDKPLLLQLDSTGIWLAGSLVEIEDLPKEIAQMLEQTPSKKLKIEVGAGVDVQTLIKMMDIAQISGAEDVEMVKAPAVANIVAPALQNVQLDQQ